MGQVGVISFSLIFTAPGQVEVRPESIPDPGPGEVLVQAALSAISPGTELLCYRGLLPSDQPLDATIAGLQHSTDYPLKYGYSLVGYIAGLGSGVETSWLGRRVFVFHPHESAFTAPVTSLIPVPDGIATEDAIFLPSVETALNFVMDAAPIIGENVVIFGQGIVGLLTAAVLRRFPLNCLATFDPVPHRRAASLALGVDASFDPYAASLKDDLRALMPHGADLAIEVSGVSQALNQAVDCTGFGGRVLVGSWYGRKPVSLDLGGSFHRSRIRLISSQVSTIDPSLSGRWSKERRFALAWQSLVWLRPSRWLTHTFPIHQAARAFQLIDQNPAETIQVALSYPPEMPAQGKIEAIDNHS